MIRNITIGKRTVRSQKSVQVVPCGYQARTKRYQAGAKWYQHGTKWYQQWMGRMGIRSAAKVAAAAAAAEITMVVVVVVHR